MITNGELEVEDAGCKQAGMDTTRLAKAIAEAIEADICDRKGIGDEWECIDGDIVQQIRKDWLEVIQEAIRNAKKTPAC